VELKLQRQIWRNRMAETTKEYVRRIRKTPGIFGDGDAVAAVGGREKLEALEAEEESQEEPRQEESQERPSLDADNDKKEEGPVREEEVSEEEKAATSEGLANFEHGDTTSYAEMQQHELSSDTSDDDSADVDESELVEKEPEKRRAEDIVKDVHVANSMIEVDTLVENDERVTVIKAAEKRRKELDTDEDTN
jgi:hypothetical protein